MQANQILRTMLKARDVSNRVMSAKLGKSSGYVSRMLAGGFCPNVNTLVEFCEALDYELVIRDRTNANEIVIEPPE